MKLIVWNTRGFNDPRKQKSVVDRINRIKADIVCLLETRIKHHKMQPVLEKHFRDWGILHNYAASPNRRIWLLWRDHVHVGPLEFSEQSITCVLQYEIRKVYFSAIYGSNDGIQRRNLWLNLTHISGIVQDNPWILTGDFNIIVHPSESSDYNGDQSANSEMKDFQNCLT
ncbi:uncharacterized protein LOC111297539 [Durio zibethinus]|uniref:Uncharacterized protein LOC111297539 n=1 Tax=Durio zibethinus TaxID=66656 RepID=A0A6P5Z5F9_DURZI|nr:uncharacterized protein LOC111297539 [Durio zibethinus]